MSECVRYKNPEVCDHLAAQYVAGHMTPLVQKRMETLLRVTPQLRQAVADWSDSLSPLQADLPSMQPPAQTLENLQKRLFQETSRESHRSATESRSFSPSNMIWKWLGLGSALASLMLLVFVVTQPAGTEWKARGADYLAPMQAMTNADDVVFVISGYQGTASGKSFLTLQWSKQADPAPEQELHLWAEDSETHAYTYLGALPEPGSSWSLSKPGWKALTQSSRLLVNTNSSQLDPNRLVFQGPCLQLKEWSQT
ncbi:hypothetical protein [Hahella ganghwensis]|uniref:hypothetical protein n=1 Tax=Hahella ganghwensis TaxID=286420 RepID=UPI0003728342|nr:hypothetical protein [Hahella ganghwensis]